MTLLSLLFAAVSLAQPEPNFRFQYMPNEGAGILPCTHERIRDLPDWEVRCEGRGLEKVFVAHVVFRELPGPRDTSRMEILYWVTERSEKKPPVFHGTTAMIRLKQKSEAASMTLSQSVENDYATLVMDWKAP